MNSRFDRTKAVGGARPTNLSLSAALVDEAKELGINISQAAAAGLQAAVGKRRAERWLEENGAALRSYNEFVSMNGLPLDK
ncbi:MAG: antitoxin CcdA, partial [Sphingomonadales bacterium]|nr:antitoxin CcdA [Sphingomonadales bacterium]